jgi:N-acetylmuramate 1-kinase
VRGICRIPLEASSERELEKELSALANRLAGTQHALVHRDLQSQNVMLREGKIYLIDFQGMRFGNRMYDLGSLLCDPYVNFSDQERDELLSFYYGLSRQEIDYTEFISSFWDASAQRLMQALGAYGFLGNKKGLNGFLEHIPAGLRNAQHAAAHASTLPRLSELLRVCLTTCIVGSARQ